MSPFASPSPSASRWRLASCILLGLFVVVCVLAALSLAAGGLLLSLFAGDSGAPSVGALSLVWLIALLPLLPLLIVLWVAFRLHRKQKYRSSCILLAIVLLLGAGGYAYARSAHLVQSSSIPSGLLAPTSASIPPGYTERLGTTWDNSDIDKGYQRDYDTRAGSMGGSLVYSELIQRVPMGRQPDYADGIASGRVNFAAEVQVEKGLTEAEQSFTYQGAPGVVFILTHQNGWSEYSLHWNDGGNDVMIDAQDSAGAFTAQKVIDLLSTLKRTT